MAEDESMTGQSTQRLFFALWPDDEVRSRLYRAARALDGVRGRPVAVGNLHITLVFLGNVGAQARACAESAAADVAGRAFTLVLDRVGAFPRARVAWLGPSHVPEALSQLAGSLSVRVAACGLELDRRPYHPHLTLLRKVSRAPAAAQLDEPVLWTVREFALIESRSSAQGVEYHSLGAWDLSQDSAG